MAVASLCRPLKGHVSRNYNFTHMLKHFRNKVRFRGDICNKHSAVSLTPESKNLILLFVLRGYTRRHVKTTALTLQCFILNSAVSITPRNFVCENTLGYE